MEKVPGESIRAAGVEECPAAHLFINIHAAIYSQPKPLAMQRLRILARSPPATAFTWPTSSVDIK